MQTQYQHHPQFQPIIMMAQPQQGFATTTTAPPPQMVMMMPPQQMVYAQPQFQQPAQPQFQQPIPALLQQPAPVPEPTSTTTSTSTTTMTPPTPAVPAVPLPLPPPPPVAQPSRATPLLTLEQICRVPNIFPRGSDMDKLHKFACEDSSKDDVCAVPSSFVSGSLGDNLYNAICKPETTMQLPNLCELASQAPQGSSEAAMYAILCKTPDVAKQEEIHQICSKPANLTEGTPEHATHYYACTK